MRTQAMLQAVRAPAFALAQALLATACMSSDGRDVSGRGAVSSASMGPDAGADAGFFGCAHDTDCVAVRLISNCCYNGWKIAVARNEVAAYLEATQCSSEAKHFCPQYIVVDTRVPACDPAELRCVMVPSDGGEGDQSPPEK